MAKRQVSGERKAIYYVGMGLTLVGFLLFASFFVTILSFFGSFGPDIPSKMGGAAARAFIGFALIVVGGFISRIGLLGAAGSGVILDPERARQDVEPLARMAGGVIGDALDEAHVNLGQAQKERVVVKCRACGMHNDEDAKFCKECGQVL
jgi:hypothetical protein